MAKSLEDTLLGLLADPAAAAAQADMAQAVALARQELSFRQRVGAAAAQLRRAREEGADTDEIAALEARLKRRSARLTGAEVQARAADVKRPAPDASSAQVFARATGKVENPPLTLAALDAKGQVAAQVASETGILHLVAKGPLEGVTLQISDKAGRVLYRGARPLDVAQGETHYLDAGLGRPWPEPGPIPERPRMPDLEGQDEGVARTLLARLGAPEPAIKSKVAEGQPGIVLEQAPKAGTVLGDATKITLTIRRARAGKPAPILVPDLVGASTATARKRLEAMGLAAVLKDKADDGPAGIVLAQKPEEGQEIDAGGSVTLIVSQASGATPETVVVPDLAGRTRDLALELLKATDLEAALTETAQPGKAGVTAQDPPAGTVLRRKSLVRLTINTPPADPARVVLPRLAGRPLDDAQEVLKALGLEAEVARQVDPAPSGQVIGQDPAAGSRVTPGGTVALAVSTGPRGKTGKAGDLTRLARAMGSDPRAEDIGDPVRIENMLRTGGAEDLEQARTLAALEVDDLRGRLGLGRLKSAERFRAMLRRALKDLG